MVFNGVTSGKYEETIFTERERWVVTGQVVRTVDRPVIVVQRVK